MSNEVIRTIQDRASSPKLVEPGPTKIQLEDILKCALRAPDHARLKPWKFWVVAGSDRTELGNVFLKAALAANLNTPDDKQLKCKNMPLRAPLIIVATCQPLITPKVPCYEQEQAVGAAIQNMQIAISSLGLGSIWRTGDMAQAPLVKQAFDLDEKGSIVGFLYVGTPEKPCASQAPTLEGYVANWPSSK